MKKRIVGLLLAATVALSANGMVFAANTKDATIDFELYALSYNQMTSMRDKQDKTAVYLYVTYLEDNPSVYVRAIGTLKDNSSQKNLTENGTTGKLVDHVTCEKGVQYSIHSQIYETGYRYAKLGFKSKNKVDTERVKGKWSPDSTTTYTHATK